MFDGLIGVVSHVGDLLTFYNMAILVVGVIGGIILGALPGVSPTLAVALLVPFTFYMDPASGLILLGAVYTSSVAGGAISAILINVPGAPANIATLLDGYPMAKSGKAEQALYICFTSSFIGGMFGMVIMIFLTLPLAEFALKFRSTEIFWIAILGLTVVAGLGTGNMIKSLISGAFGLWLSTIGSNPVTGEFRFVFHDILMGGVNILPALIGLFAIPQAFSLAESHSVQRTSFKIQREKGLFAKTFLQMIKMFRVQAVGSIVGSIVGIIPGVGGQVAGIVSYDQVKKLSRRPDKFGTGIPEGVAAAESANNAMVGPSLIPLLTLSVPGSPTAAVLLGGLLIHGIFPGPDLFRLHPAIVHTFIGSLVLAQVGMFIFGTIIARYSNWVVRVPDIYMSVSIIILATFGTYCVSNNFQDVIIMFGIGIIMFFGDKFGFSALPVVMGVILGVIAENSFLKAYMISTSASGFFTYFFTGWINVIIIMLCLFSLAYGVYSGVRGKKAQPSRKDIVVSVVVLIVGISLYCSLDMKNPLSHIFPSATIIAMIVLSGLLFIMTVSAIKRKTIVGETGVTHYALSRTRLVITIVLTVGYLCLLDIAGFYFTSMLFFFVFSSIIALNKQYFFDHIRSRVITSLCFVAVLYLIFKVILKVHTPTGFLF